MRRVGAGDFVVSFDQLVVLLALDLLLLEGVDWLTAAPDANFDPYNIVYSWMPYLLGGLWAAALIARIQGAYTGTRELLVVWLASAPLIIVLTGTLLVFAPLAQEHVPYVLLGTAAVLIAMTELAARRIFGRDRFGTIVIAVVAIVGLPWILSELLYLEPRLWTVTQATAESVPEPDAEALLFEQPARITAAVDVTSEERPGVVDMYYIGFAGYGAQSVFRNEALFGEKVFGKRFGADSRSIELINDDEDRDTYPLATASGLRYALELLGERMNKDEDVLVLLLTSHGSREEGIAIENGGLPLQNLDPDELRSALDDSGIKWRIVIVSACYAGVFLEPLKSDTTLVITAADAFHNSFGCADDRDLTYFGEAFLRDALPGAPTLEAAFARARALIASREAAEKLTPSNPQMSVGPAIRRKLATPAHPTDEDPESDATGVTLTASVTGFRGPRP